MITKMVTATGRIWKPGDVIEIKSELETPSRDAPIIASLIPLKDFNGIVYAISALDTNKKQIGIIFPCGAVIKTDGDINNV